MASKGKIPIKAASDISRKYDCPMVIVFGLSESGETFHLTTYGASKALCKHADHLADQIADKIFKGEIAPAKSETLTGGEPISEERNLGTKEG